MIGNIAALAIVPVAGVAGIIFGLLFKGLDRVLGARMQARVGPPLLQPFIDVKKLLMKENIVPQNAVAWLFNAAPVAALCASIALLLYIPLFGSGALLEGSGDMVLVVYLLLLPSLAMVAGGFASGSHYATVGAQREMVAMLSYEFPLAIAVVSAAWLLASKAIAVQAFSLAALSAFPLWSLVGTLGFVGLAVLLAVLLFVMPGELGKAPFDVAEAETEIAGGVLAEYSGVNLALFYLADAVKSFAMAAIIVAIFLPWNATAMLSISDMWAGAAAGALFFLAKVFAVMFAGNTFMRIALARLRITQVVRVYWGYASAAALAGLLLIAAELVLVV
ncbi:MAG: NADH-quinone oxidoreductase subunit H [Candidatus Diapherotrites archaeon]|nr:NADH-quinone oxidoreductase subunit H [Candidatus Diapherotrites archaeon]